ncbi:LamG-like jellyroll fold domain-containing protein [Thermomonospora amylolytica]|uniref:LamG-like jellyroll fold domain-containing protein n=1 Tax=Thermomonospora amylolytica TaxID=1411117 RepID=UPI000E6C8C5C|nr:LamG-like jellyroll fold domain-containing protein [Thermomonospora amylolytica]
MAMVSTVTVAIAGPPEPAAADPAPQASAEDGALETARRTGKPVEVESLRTSTRQVFAQPSGSFRMEQSLRPRWVRRAGKWVDVDPTLRRNSDGTVAPAAAVLDLRLSGGGDRPLVALGNGAQSMEFHWPHKLPQPTLDGDTATYAEVLPGVDLQVRADIEGFVWALVVKNARAAKNPALRRITLRTVGRGMSIRANPKGGADILDAAGGQVLYAPTPLMWDSSDASAASGTPQRLRAQGKVSPRLQGPAVGARRKQIGLEVGSGGLSVIPDRNMLEDPDTAFPVVIDPPLTMGRAAWAKVSSGHPGQEYPNGGIDGSYGEVGNAGDDGQVWRTFYRFNMPGALYGKQILSSRLHLRLTHSWSCEARAIQVHRTGGFGAYTNWRNQPAWRGLLDEVSAGKGHGADCPAGDVELDVKAAVAAAAADERPTLTLGIRAKDEHDSHAWKRFGSTPEQVKLVTEYNAVPRRPELAEMRVQPGGWCSGGSSSDPVPVNRTDPVFHARLHDADGTVRGVFELREAAPDGSAPLRLSHTSPLNSTGLEHQWQVPAGALEDGKRYRLTVKAVDENGAASEFSDACWIRIDTGNPQSLPTVTSPDYPSVDQAPEGSDGVGQPGRFVLSANGDTDVTAFRYGLDDPYCSQGPVAADVPGGTRTVILTPQTEGVRVLYAAGVDAAGNWSQAGCSAVYTFNVKGAAPPVSHFLLDENSGDSAHDAKNDGRTLTLADGAGWAPGRMNSALSLNGGTAHAATTGPVVDTAKAFTVSAWARLTDKSADRIVVSQTGERAAGFQLHYDAQADRWMFSRPVTDADSPAFARAVGAHSPAVNAWTHLMGVHDPGKGQLRLYVNGRLEGWASFTSPWNATGGLQVGRTKHNGVFTGGFAGQIDNIRIWQRLVGEPAPVPEAYFQLNEANGEPLRDLIYRGRTLTLGPGAAQIDDARYGRGLSFDGGADAHATTSGEVVRTDQAFSAGIWVKLADKNLTYSLLSQTGSRTSAFQLSYSKDDDRWVFGRHDSDSDDATQIRAVSTSVPSLEWTHLLGVYDPVARQIRLYVDGRLESSVAYTGTPWHAEQLQIGRTKSEGRFQGNAKAQIDEVKLWDRAIDHDPYRTAPATETADPSDPYGKPEVWKEANSPVQLAAHWKLDPSEDGTTAPSEHGNTTPLTLQGGAALLPDDLFWTQDGMGFLGLDGIDDQAVASGPIARTDRSFSVAAWVRVTGNPASWPDGKNGASVVSQDGEVGNGFSLWAERYGPTGSDTSGERFRWTFSTVGDDTMSPTVHRARSEEVVQYEPVHLVGVYDMTERRIMLYVNGQLARSAQAPFTRAWAALRQFRIGTARNGGSFANDFLPGQVDEVSVYAGVLTQPDVLKVGAGAYPIGTVH